MRKITAGRVAWLVPLAAAVALVCAVAAYGVNRHARVDDARDRQLVHDQDVGPAAGVRSDRVDHRSRALRHALHVQGRTIWLIPIPLARAVVEGDEGREDVHLPAEAERAFRRRDAVDVGRRRVLAAPSRQPQGQPVVPARRRDGEGGGRVRRRPALDDTEHGSCRRFSPTRRPASSTRSSSRQHGGTDAANAAKADKAENWLNSSSSVGAGSGPVRAQRVLDDVADHADAEREVLGLAQAGILERRRAQHDRTDAADQHPARLARDRDRPVGRSGEGRSRASRS